MTKKKGLGRGLSALLEDPSTDITTRNEPVRAAPPRSAVKSHRHHAGRADRTEPLPAAHPFQ
jgi:hypothetical protein